MELREPGPVPEEEIGKRVLKKEAAAGGGLDAVHAPYVQGVLERGAPLGVPAAALQEAEEDARVGKRTSIPAPIPCFVVVGQNGPVGETVGGVGHLTGVVAVLTASVQEEPGDGAATSSETSGGPVSVVFTVISTTS